MPGKIALRKVMRETLAGLSTAAIDAKSAHICAEILATEEWRTAQTVCLFAAQAHEPNLDGLWAHRESRCFCFPRVNGVALDLLRVDSPAELTMSRWQVREPLHDSASIVELAAVDLILVPGVAFTVAGARLGRGGGFYDRFLARPGWRARTFGICLAEQLCDSIPTEPHDRGVDRVIRA